jgi:hypothetical protein
MKRKEMMGMTNDELRLLRHKYLGMVGETVAETDRINKTLMRIRQELFIRQAQ